MLRPLASGGPWSSSVKSRSSGMLAPSIQKQVGRFTSPLGEGSERIVPAPAWRPLTTWETKGATAGGGEVAGVIGWGWLVMQGSPADADPPSAQKVVQRGEAWQAWSWNVPWRT